MLRPTSAAGFGGGGGLYSGDEPSAEVWLGEAIVVQQDVSLRWYVALVAQWFPEKPFRQSPMSLAVCNRYIIA